MSAVISPTSAAHSIGRPRAAERAPLQVDLLGIDAAPTVPEVRYSIVGQVQRMAEVRLAPDGQHAHLVVQILQPPHGGHSRLPIVCIYHAHQAAGCNAEILALQALAALLHPGTLVLAICRGLDFDDKRHELRAWRTDRLTLVGPAEAALYLPDHQLDQDHPQ